MTTGGNVQDGPGSASRSPEHQRNGLPCMQLMTASNTTSSWNYQTRKPLKIVCSIHPPLPSLYIGWLAKTCFMQLSTYSTTHLSPVRYLIVQEDASLQLQRIDGWMNFRGMGLDHKLRLLGWSCFPHFLNEYMQPAAENSPRAATEVIVEFAM